jgi:hypothetical protein
MAEVISVPIKRACAAVVARDWSEPSGPGTISLLLGRLPGPCAIPTSRLLLPLAITSVTSEAVVDALSTVVYAALVEMPCFQPHEQCMTAAGQAHAAAEAVVNQQELAQSFSPLLLYYRGSSGLN